MTLQWTLRHHAIAWLVLSAFALAYLTSLALWPRDDGELASTVSPTAPALGKRAARTGRLWDQETTELRREIKILHRNLEALTKREKDLERRLGAIEQALGPPTAALPPTDLRPPTTTASLRETGTLPQPLPPVSVRLLGMPEDGFGDILYNHSPLPVAGTPNTTRTLFGVELASDANAQALHKAWATLGARHKALLAGLEARHREAPVDDETAGHSSQLTLVAGPFTNAADAAKLCARLRATGTPCKETVFAGEAF